MRGDSATSRRTAAKLLRIEAAMRENGIETEYPRIRDAANRRRTPGRVDGGVGGRKVEANLFLAAISPNGERGVARDVAQGQGIYNPIRSAAIRDRFGGLSAADDARRPRERRLYEARNGGVSAARAAGARTADDAAAGGSGGETASSGKEGFRDSQAEERVGGEFEDSFRSSNGGKR